MENLLVGVSSCEIKIAEDVNVVKETCGICGNNHKTDNCDIYPIVNLVPNKEIPSKARLSLPNFLEIKIYSDGTSDVFTSKLIGKGTRLGPYQAKTLFTLLPSISFPLKIFMTENSDWSEYFLDTSNENECSWLYFVQPATDSEEQNLICYQDGNNVFYGSIKDIKPGECLKVWYAPFYAQKMNKNLLNSSQLDFEEDADEVDLNELVKTQQKIMERDNWNCKFCGKIELKITDFANHLLEHYKIQLKKTCEICKATFASRNNLQKHLKIVHSNLNVAPHQEMKVSNLQTSAALLDMAVGGPLLNESLLDSSDNSNLIFQQTDLKQFDLSNITNHNHLIDSENFNVDHLLNENVKELDHFNFELNDADEAIICDICLKVFSKLNRLIQHLQQHTAKYWCKECKKVFGRKENFDMHACNKVYNFICTYCEKIFVQKKYLNQHIRAVHNKSYKCDNCTNFYSSKQELQEHNCLRVPLSQKPKFYCKECNKVFFREKYLKSHSKIHLPKTEEQKKIVAVCEVCSKVFATKVGLLTHMKNHRSPEMSCEICDKKFHRLDVLNNHLLTHMSDQPEECEICNKKFKSKKFLQAHMQTHQEKQFSCTKCEAKFKQKVNLTNHLKNHDKIVDLKSINIYTCPVCNKIMKLKSSLYRHIKRTHPNYDYTYLCNVKPTKHKFEKEAKDKVDTTGKENDIIMMDLKETIENMNFTTDISLGANDEQINNLGVEFEEMLKNTTESIDFLNESGDKMVENLLNITADKFQIDGVQEKQKEVCLSMPDLSEVDQEIKLGENAFILDNGTIVEPQDTSGKIIYYVLDDKFS